MPPADLAEARQQLPAALLRIGDEALALDHIEGPKRRKGFVALSMTLNLGLLGTFKYYDFFAESLQLMVARLGYSMDIRHLDLLLPIGISFYTFQSMSYVIDVYRREVRPTRNLTEFAAFVSFFPHLVAGPIMRPTSLMPQIERKRRFDIEQFYSGCYLIFWGLTKKVAIADNLAVLVNDVFGKWQTIDGGMALLGIYAFAFQIYCDFSGYTDAARGVAKLLGFELALNFNLPYFSMSPKEFWGRWHISLSTWLRDYLYIPLGGNRGGRWSELRNLGTTMLLGGIWHGAAWTFVIWGAIHGGALIVERLWRQLRGRLGWSGLPTFAAWPLTLFVVMMAWVPFRAESLSAAWNMWSAMLAGPLLPDRARVTLGPALSGWLESLGVGMSGPMQLGLGDWVVALPLLGFSFLLAVFMPTGYRLCSHLLSPMEREGSRLGVAGGGALVASLLVGSLVYLSYNTVFLYYQF